MRKKILIIIVIILSFLNLNSQNLFVDSLIQKAENTKEDSLKIKIYRQIYENQISKNPQISLSFAKKNCKLSEKNKDAKSQCLALNSIGGIFTQTGKKDSASILLQKSLHIADSINYLYGIAESNYYLSRIHFLSDNFDYAIHNAEKALKIFIKLDSIKNVPSCYNAMGNAYKDMGMSEKDENKKNELYNKSLDNYFKGFKITKNLKRKSILLANIANTFIQQKKYQSALKNTKKAIKIAEQTQDNYTLSYAYLINGWVLSFLKRNEEAIEDLHKSRNYARKIKNKSSILWATNCLKDTYRASGNLEEALKEGEYYIALKDSLFLLDKQKIINDIEIKYLTKEKEHQNKQLQLEKEHAQQIIWIGIIVIFVMSFLLTIVLFLFVKKKKAEEKISKQAKILQKQNKQISIQNEELNTTLETINLQKRKIEKSHKNITASINYASRIQQALLSSEKIFYENLSSYFILFKPRDIVSGDFYYCKKVNEYLVIAAADCTGHGVPGAFVSMLGISLLNEIVGKKENLKANQILENLRTQIKISLKQSKSKTGSKDGMDIALCVINTETDILQFSGAFNPLYLIRNKKMIITKATRNPIGIYIKEKPFENHEIQLQKNDIFYIFSDGFPDQFGGEKNKKFLSKNFRKLLIEISEKSLPEQKEILNSTLENWKKGKEQNDDILVLGVKI